MERYGSRTKAQKLGIKPGSVVAVIDPPRDYEAAIGDLPEGVDFAENPSVGTPGDFMVHPRSRGISRRIAPHVGDRR